MIPGDKDRCNAICHAGHRCTARKRKGSFCGVHDGEAMAARRNRERKKFAALVESHRRDQEEARFKRQVVLAACALVKTWVKLPQTPEQTTLLDAVIAYEEFLTFRGRP